jgi:hypothetical protein
VFLFLGIAQDLSTCLAKERKKSNIAEITESIKISIYAPTLTSLAKNK